MEEKQMSPKPKASSSFAQKELDKAEKQFEAFDANVKEMTMDRMNMAPRPEEEPQTKISSKEAQRAGGIYLKPEKYIGVRDKFNEKFRPDREFDCEYVNFIAEHKEIIGETIEIWTRPYGGMPAEFWKVPTNKPVWGPRYLAEQIKKKNYHRLVMQENMSAGADGMAQYYGRMAVDTTVQRLDAHPVTSRKSVFMGSNNF